MRHTSHSSASSGSKLRGLFVLAVGCVASLTSSAGTTTYSYDVHGRLQVVRAPTGSDRTATTHIYDAAGNRESVVVAFEDITPPNAPTSLTATAQAFDRIRLSWTTSLDAGGGPVTYYKVYRGGSHIASPNAPPFDDWPLTANTTYSYRVSAVDPSGNESAQTAPANATTPPGPDLTAPSVPTNLQGSAASGTAINLSWGASTDNPGGSGLAGYEVFRNNGATPIGSPSSTSFSDTSATPATTYQYKVRAYDVAGNRSASPVRFPSPRPTRWHQAHRARRRSVRLRAAARQRAGPPPPTTSR